MSDAIKAPGFVPVRQVTVKALSGLMRMGRPVGTLSTYAVKAPVVGADAAGGLKRFAECPAGSMEPYGGVIGGHTKVARDLRERLIPQLHPQDHLVVFVLQILSYVFDTVTHLTKQLFVIDHGLRFDFRSQTFPQAAVGRPPPIMVDEQIPKQLIKPRHDLFFFANGPGVGDRSHIACLEQIFCVRPTTQTPLQKGQETVLALHQDVDMGCGHLVTYRSFLPRNTRDFGCSAALKGHEYRFLPSS